MAEDANAEIENIDLERQLEVPKPKLVSKLVLRAILTVLLKK